MAASMINTPNHIHLRDPENPDKTWCGRVILEAVRVTENPGQVTCPKCIKEDGGESVMPRSLYPVSMSMAA